MQIYFIYIYLTLLTNVFAADLRWYNTTKLIK